MYNQDMKKPHIPVLLDEVLGLLNPQEGEKYIDLTAGYGGHAEKVLAATRNYKGAKLIDRDREAVEFLKTEFPEATIVHADYYSAVQQMKMCGEKFDLALMDLGVSSLQLDKSSRGFSFSNDGPLDMRMDQNNPLSAEKVVNHYSKNELQRVFEAYAEENPRRAAFLAQKIVENRPFTRTKELSELIQRYSKWSRTNPATRIFQAIRIEVNDELSELEKTLPELLSILNPGARIAIISFHSLEDRIVKEFFKAESALGEESELEILTKKPVVAAKNELVINPRARSAKLRAAKRLSTH